jgi:hypothetical protein
MLEIKFSMGIKSEYRVTEVENEHLLSVKLIKIREIMSTK